MKVVHINTNSNGGAANAAIRIHLSLLDKGIESHILFLKRKPKELKNAHELSEYFPKWKVFLFDKLNRFFNQLQLLGKPKSFFNSPKSFFRLHNIQIVKDADIINLHWVVKFVDIPSFFKGINKPVAWTLHDMNPFSGGLHYLSDFYPKQYSAKEEHYKRVKTEAYKYSKIGIIGPSAWIVNLAINSDTFPKSTIYENIKNTVDTKVFFPKSKEKENHESPIVLFVAEKAEDKRKGLKYLMMAIDRLNDLKIKWVVVGNKSENLPKFVSQTGYLYSDKDLAEWYNKAEVFVIPSIEDNLPNTVVESLACGTPVIGFDTGGIKEMIINNQTGLLIRNQDSEALANGIRELISNYSKKSLSQFSRDFAERNFSPNIVSEKYISFYKKLLDIKE